jgi:hypothetical protein
MWVAESRFRRDSGASRTSSPRPLTKARPGLSGSPGIGALFCQSNRPAGVACQPPRCHERRIYVRSSRILGVSPDAVSTARPYRHNVRVCADFTEFSCFEKNSPPIIELWSDMKLMVRIRNIIVGAHEVGCIVPMLEPALSIDHQAIRGIRKMSEFSQFRRRLLVVGVALSAHSDT